MREQDCLPWFHECFFIRKILNNFLAAASAQFEGMDMGGMMAQFMPMVEAKYNSLDHEQVNNYRME